MPSIKQGLFISLLNLAFKLALLYDIIATSPQLIRSRLDRDGRLPPELHQAVFQRLGAGDIQTLRLVSGCYNALATPFLLDEVRLFFHPKSIERLLATSRHPVISKLLKSLVYQTDMLQNLESKKEWEEGIFDPRNIPKIPLRPPTGANYDEFHTYIVALKEFRRKPLHSLTREQ